MNAKTEQTVSLFDKAKLLLAVVFVIGGLFGYYYYGTQFSQVYRVAGILLAAILAFVLAITTAPGRQFWHFAQSSRIELRKVIWPTRQEALQTTLAVIVFVIVMGIFFWALDLFLLWGTQTIRAFGT